MENLKQTPTPTTPQENSEPLVVVQSDAKLQATIDDIRRDYKISPDEFPVLRITLLRQRIQMLDERMDSLQAVLESLKKKGEGNSQEAAKTLTEMSDLEQRRIIYAEQIAQEKVLTETVALYGRFRATYREAKKKMEEFGSKPIAGDEQLQAKRERDVDDQMERIGELFVRRAALGTIYDNYIVAFPRGAENAEPASAKAAEQFRTSLTEYFNKYKLQLPLKPNGSVDLAKAILIVQQERVTVEDRIIAELHYASPALVEAEHLYRRFAWALQKLPEDRATVETDMRRFIEKVRREHAGVQDLEQAAKDMEAMLQKQNVSTIDVIEAFRKLPKKQPETALLLADLLTSWLKQLADSPNVNSDARKEAIKLSHLAVMDIMRLQQTFIREFSGHEHIRTWYEPSKKSTATMKDPLTEGLLESHRAERDVRLGEVEFAINQYEHSVSANWDDRARDTASGLVVEPARAIMSQIDRLFGSDTQKTVNKGGMVEIMNRYDKRVLASIREDIELFRTFSKSPKMKPEEIRKELEDMPPEKAAQVQQRALDMQGTLTVEQAQRMMSEGDAETRLALWLWLEQKFQNDLGRFDAEQSKLFEQLREKGDEGKNILADLERWGDQMRRFLIWCVVALIAGYALINWGPSLAARGIEWLLSSRKSGTTGPDEAPSTGPRRPRVFERRVSANERVQEYFKSPGAQKMIGDLEGLRIRTTEAQKLLDNVRNLHLEGLDDATYAARVAALEQGLDSKLVAILKQPRTKHVAALQQFLDDLADTDDMLRCMMTRDMFGLTFDPTPTQRSALRAAHRQPLLKSKERILREVFTEEEVTMLLNSGACGDAGKAAARLGGGTVSQATEGLVQPLSPGHVPLSRIRVAGASRGRVRGTPSGRPLTEVEKATVGNWLESPAFGRMLYFAGAALEAYIVYEDLLALQRADEAYQEASKRMQKDLDDLTKGDSPLLTKKGNVYWYQDKVSIDASRLDPSAEKTAANWRLGVDATSLAAFLAAGAGVEFPPALPVIIIVVHLTINAWEKNAYYDFVRQCPPWLLAYFNGTIPTINQAEESLVMDTWADVTLTLTSWLKLTTPKDIEVRKKLFFSIFLREIKSNDPQVYAEIMANYGSSPDGMQKFYEGDFQTYILPFYKTEIFVRGFRANVSLGFLDYLDTDMVFNPSIGFQPIIPEIAAELKPQDIVAALREAGGMYVSHLREKRFLDVTEELKTESDPLRRELLEAMRYELGSRHVLNTRLLDIETSLQANKGKTRMELLMERYRDALKRAGGGKGGTWVKIMAYERSQEHGTPHKFRAKLQPMYTPGIFPGNNTITTDSSASHVFSYDRDFDIGTDGIAGLERIGKDGKIAFSDTTFRNPENQAVPRMERVFPPLEPLVGVRAFTELNATRMQLMRQYEMISRSHRKLNFLESYLTLRGRVEVADGSVSNLRSQIEAKNKQIQAQEVVVRNQRNGGGRYGAPAINALRTMKEQLATLKTQQLDSEKQALAARMRLERHCATFDTDQCKRFNDMKLAEVYGEFRKDISLFFLDMAQCERDTKWYVEMEKGLIALTADTHKKASWPQLLSLGGEPNEELATVVRDNGRSVPVSVTGKIDESDIRALKELISFPAKANDYQISSKMLYSVHCQKIEEPNKTIRYLITFVVSSHPVYLGDEPERTSVKQQEWIKPQFIQLGAVRSEGSEYLEVGLPIDAESDEVLPKRMKSMVLDEAVSTRRKMHEQSDKAILLGMSRAERIFRAAGSNTLTQIDRTTWGACVTKDRQKYLVLVRKSSNGGWESKFVWLPEGKVSLEQLDRSIEHSRTSGGRIGGEKKLLPGEMQSANKMEADFDKEQWMPAVAGVMADGLIKKGFNNPLPEDVLDILDPVQVAPENVGVMEKVQFRLGQYYSQLPAMPEKTFQRVEALILKGIDTRRAMLPQNPADTATIDNVINFAIQDAETILAEGPIEERPNFGLQEVFANLKRFPY